MKELVLLVVDDDDLVIQSLKSVLPEQWRLMACQDPANLPARGFHAALVDMHLSQNTAVNPEGVEVIRSLTQRHANLEVVAMSGDLNRQMMESCLRAGATRFLAKPLNLDEVLLTLDKIESYFLLQNLAVRTSTQGASWIGQSAVSTRIRRQIAELRNELGPILLEGESGTGKEVAANLIHMQQNGGPLVVINVAGIPDNLFESEFFGHIKGAFTGADQNKMGLAEAAQGGDLFLDEIEAMSLPHQAKVLRFLETGEVRRIGSKESVHVHTRVIAATNRKLNQLVSEGKFREDLLWRLSGKRIQLPPLRDRLDDVAELASHFFAQDKLRVKKFEPEAIECLREYSWPGNVRELKRVCEQLLLQAPLPVIRKEDVLRIIQPSTTGSSASKLLDLSLGLARLLSDFESMVIQKVMDQEDDIDEAARTLKISRSSLYKKIKDHDIQWRSE